MKPRSLVQIVAAQRHVIWINRAPFAILVKFRCLAAGELKIAGMLRCSKRKLFGIFPLMHDQLSKVIVLWLRGLAESIQMAGQRASVVETGPMGSPETSTAQAKITIIPRGHDAGTPDDRAAGGEETGKKIYWPCIDDPSRLD